MGSENMWFYGWSALLAAMLFIPVSKLVWTLSIRRQQRKLGRFLDETELAGQMKRARFISFLLVVPFALLFNANLFGFPGAK